jgi:hypothetical protein
MKPGKVAVAARYYCRLGRMAVAEHWETELATLAGASGAVAR